MLETPNLSGSWNPVPKPNRKVKMPTPMKNVGKKTNEWTEARNILKERFFKVGLTSCEIRLKAGCTKDNNLGFAHLDKRRNLTKEDLYDVVLACNFCHTETEFGKKAKQMRPVLQGIIDKRKVKV